MTLATDNRFDVTKKQIGVKEPLWWVYLREHKPDRVEFTGDIFWSKQKADEYMKQLLLEYL